jgi:endo-1,4-beta-D-glucanase Y
MKNPQLKSYRRVRNTFITFGILLLVTGAGVLMYALYDNSPQHGTPLVFSNKEMLYELWSAYKQNNIEPGTNRTIDKTAGNITTSEGESYTMLRSVWMDDKSTFDNSLKWTQDNLQRPDYLFSWKFGKQPSGKYGILTDQGGTNTASDGDTDIALSLLMAYQRWGDSKYLHIAQTVIPQIWEKEVVLAGGKPVMTADDLERNSQTNLVINPSYMSPYAYKIFAHVDGTHNWLGLADNSYAVLTAASSSKLDSNASSGLPPNWLLLSRTSGTSVTSSSGDLNSNYSYDAIRVPWRLALDYNWFKDPRDKTLLSNYSFLADAWQKSQRLQASYGHDGSVLSRDQSPAIYGASIGYFIVEKPSMAKQIYQQKLISLYSPDTQLWRTPLSYYDDNWTWFGMALTQNALPNLALSNNGKI